MHEDIKQTFVALKMHLLSTTRGMSQQRALCVSSGVVKRIAKLLAMLILGLVVVVGIVIGWRHRLEERAREKREAEYELSRRKYAEALRPGITRKEVEVYLHKNNVVILNSWPDDLVKVGQEDPPWFCSEADVFVAFRFDNRGEQSSRWAQSDSDILTAVSVTRRADGCL